MVHTVNLDECMAVALRAAQTAGQLIKDGFSAPKNVEHKGKVDLVTQTDKDAESAIISTLRAAFPEHKFIGEESSAEQGFTSELTDEPTWCIDPLDGTTNFVHRFPFVCTCIGLVVNKQPVLGVVYNPVLGEMFSAIRGRGATLNGQPITVSDTSDIGSALLATEVGVSRDDATMTAITDRLKVGVYRDDATTTALTDKLKALTSQSRSVRCCGSCALNLCGVACGRLDAFYEIGFGGCWDVAGASVVVEEAGGKMLDPCGAPFDIMSRRVLGTNGKLAETYAALLAKAPIGPSEPVLKS